MWLRKFFVRPPDLSGLKSGEAGEAWVCYLYQRRGYQVIARNYEVYGRKKLGELDLIFENRKRLFVVEVRTRRDENFMKIVETVDWRKQSYLRRMTKLFLQQNPKFADYEVQIDVAAVLLDPFDNRVKSVKLIENAIEDSN